MKIQVTREIIEGTSGDPDDLFNCVGARAITEATGRKVLVALSSGTFEDNNCEGFVLDAVGVDFVRRYIRHGKQYERKRWFRKPKILQPEGSFEISWNPPTKNWSYKTAEPQVLEEQIA